MSRYNDTETVKKCCDGYKFYDYVNEKGIVDTRILVIEDCKGNKTKVFKSDLIICLKNFQSCPTTRDDYSKSNMKCPYLLIQGRSACCANPWDCKTIVITSTSEEALTQLCKSLISAVAGGSKFFREVYKLTQEIETPAGFEIEKVFVYKNGSLLIEGEGYTIVDGIITLADMPKSGECPDLIEVIGLG